MRSAAGEVGVVLPLNLTDLCKFKCVRQNKYYFLCVQKCIEVIRLTALINQLGKIVKTEFGNLKQLTAHLGRIHISNSVRPF